MHVEYNASRAIAILVTTALLLNAMAPTLAQAAIYLQGTEVNANTLVQDAYVAVTYYDSNGKQKLEKGWIDAVGETSFTIRSGGIKDKKTIAYEKVLSVFMSDETNTLKQINEVNQFIGDKKRGEELKAITIMSGGQIDLSKIRKGWYAHVIYTSEGGEEIVTGRITRQDSVHIVIRVWEEGALRVLKTIAYKDIDTLVISQHAQRIETWKNAKQVQRRLKNEYNTKVRVQASSIWKNRVVGRLVKMTPDTLVISRGGTFFQVPVSSISNFEVSLGQHRNTGKGLLIGLGTGLAVFIVGSERARNIAEANPEVEFASLGTALGTMAICGLILVLSPLIGYNTKSDKWVAVPPQRLNLSLAPTSTKRLRAALTFNF